MNNVCSIKFEHRLSNIKNKSANLTVFNAIGKIFFKKKYKCTKLELKQKEKCAQNERKVNYFENLIRKWKLFSLMCTKLEE